MPNSRINRSMVKTPMPTQEPQLRAHNFEEVSLGYTQEEALAEALRCLQCRRPLCVEGCPVNVHIPEFIAKLAEGDAEGAYQEIRITNSLPAICGRVCPQESQCEGLCVRGRKGEPVAIGRLERFVADQHLQRQQSAPASDGPAEPTPGPGAGIKVAVVGSGPSGLACAGDLARLGYQVTIFEAFHTAGGVLMYGIPEFRLPKALVQSEIAEVTGLGVEVATNMVIGRVLSLAELQELGYRAVFIGTGAGLPSFMGIPGENLNGVYSANEYLTRVNLMQAYRFPASDTPIQHGRAVAVIGGGNVAMDAARVALRIGAERVHIVYRRGEQEMPARREEVEHAREEGVDFLMLSAPTAVLGDEQGWVRGLECVRMELGEADESGRRRPVPLPGSDFLLEVDTVVVAIGTSPNPLITSTTPGLDTRSWGGIVVTEESGATSLEGVYAGGDAVTGSATVILAMGAGKTAARAIHQQLQAELAG